MAGLTLVGALLATTRAGAQLPSTGGQVWGTGNLWVQLPSHLRVVLIGEYNDGTNYDYQQWSGGVGVGYQWKRVTRLTHLVNINSDKESRLVLAAGYEYLWTRQEGDATTKEDRFLIQATPRYRPFGRWLLEDRNRVELRWVDGAYKSRYRNRLSIERDLLVDHFRFTPYVSAELFYDLSNGTWNEQQYSVGIQWPYRRIFMLETYYLYQHTSASPQNVNVLGITLNFYLHNDL